MELGMPGSITTFQIGPFLAYLFRWKHFSTILVQLARDSLPSGTPQGFIRFAIYFSFLHNID